MAGKYEKAITIKEAIDAINQRDFLLPAIQRKFVWSHQQICVLFDSIMRGYPINSFMMWEVINDNIKNEYKFYEFLRNYCERFNEENPLIVTNAGFKSFKAIIDGQQRLTALYIGLCGTFAYKQPRIRWPTARNDEALPPRKLYLDLAKPMDSDEKESMMQFNFRFLTQKQFQDYSSNPDNEHHWFCLHEILKMPEEKGEVHVRSKVVSPYLEEHGILDNKYAQDTLYQLYEVIRSKHIIHYFNETDQKPDHVLDIFIRTNSGGTQLSFSDLLMSIAVANWNGDFRQELDGLINTIHQSADMNFYMERDWVLKTCLTLTGADVRFKVENFGGEQVSKIQTCWPIIKACIQETLRLIRRFGINPKSLISKNAVIPVAYYLYKKQIGSEPLFKTINNLAKHYEQRDLISRWFYMALLKGVFGGQADTILKTMRDELDKRLDKPLFPLEEIIDRFTATNKDLRFDNKYIESLLNIEHGEGRCRALLHLLFPEMNATEVFHIDHLHPKTMFDKKNLKKLSFLGENEEMIAFYSDPQHWNSIANLHLLNSSQNESKNGKSLKEWLDDPNVHLTAESLLVQGVNLDFEAFPEFFEKRRAALKKRLEERVFISATITGEPETNEQDEQVNEETLL